jgi:hypothetical protein
MNSSDYALLISIASFFIAFAALLWNVWQKFIFVKPSLQALFGIWRIFQPGSADHNRRLLCLTVANMGPGPAVLQLCIAKEKLKWWKRRRSYGTLNPIHGDPADPNPTGIGPFGGGLPAKIDAGEVKSFYFPYQRDCFLKERLARVGIYHRMIWCRRGDLKKVYEGYKRDFGEGRS